MPQRTDCAVPGQPVAKVTATDPADPLDFLVNALNRAVARKQATGMEDKEHKI